MSKSDNNEDSLSALTDGILDDRFNTQLSQIADSIHNTSSNTLVSVDLSTPGTVPSLVNI